MRKRVIVIGSGLGGLSVGVMLARNGYDVTVVEQEAVIGGCLQCFYRNGARFETGLHYVGSADPGQQLYRVLQWLEVLDGITLDRLDTDGYNVISMGGNRFSIPNGREAFIERMGERMFPETESYRKSKESSPKGQDVSVLVSFPMGLNDMILRTVEFTTLFSSNQELIKTAVHWMLNHMDDVEEALEVISEFQSTKDNGKTLENELERIRNELQNTD